MIRPLVTFGILIYAVILVLAAWPREIMLAPLKAPTHWAKQALRPTGIYPGLMVFSSTLNEAPADLIRSQCFFARTLDKNGTIRDLSLQGSCPSPPVRLWISPEEVLLNHLAISFSTFEDNIRAGNLAEDMRSLSNRALKCIAQHYFWREKLDSHDVSEILFHWENRYASGQVSSLLCFRWERASRKILECKVYPDRATVDEMWNTWETSK